MTILFSMQIDVKQDMPFVLRNFTERRDLMECVFTKAQTVSLEKWEREPSLNFVEFIEFCPRRCKRRQEALCMTRRMRLPNVQLPRLSLTYNKNTVNAVKPANMVIFTVLNVFRGHYIC